MSLFKIDCVSIYKTSSELVLAMMHFLIYQFSGYCQVPAELYHSKYYREILKGEFDDKRAAVECTRLAILALRAC